jgi:molecular chaperone DnaK
MALDNRSLGRFILDGLPPAPRGMPQIEVTFDIDANGILSVNAQDKATSKEQSIRIEGSSGMDQSEIDRMVNEAQQHASEDKTRREAIDVRNTLDSMVYEAEKMLNEHREKIPIADLNTAESAVSDAKALLEREDASVEELKAKTDELQGALHKVSETLYKAQAEAAGAEGPPPGGAPPGGAPPGGEDVVDAEFTEEN